MAKGGARPGAGRPKGSHNLADALRAACREAMEKSAAEGKPLSDLLKTEMQAAPAAFIRAVASLLPKDVNVTHSVNPFDGIADAELAALLVAARHAASLGSGDGPAIIEGESQELH